ncbi:MAG: Crp/Fnr family transcriptional regulator [Gammaproteobacteria bacterium]|nr:Crp/Fnr family transcriptional regulator [Gammaproteobacteria bacterium]MCW8841429.1 Crp/Fnr family transcriptional regulator [Gammaproteobacteria bacterium]MCW8927335.1 Crp/Fnr family transcriptional regulator [Gammaproteobacteria bacterium]MCW8957676.1 Crp/Fnr family transcriptional regulator [Gammaproteobacteria bacterium]MCW8971727.1 Crp/Fnr family transcriptional regulator [Gammaproteobacteria bacterium]
MTAIYGRLSEAEQKTLLDFAEFLATRSEPAETLSLELKAIPRPQEESVVAAMKRLRETYHMLDHSKMLHEASGLMAQHMMQGRPAEEVIDELEKIFRRDFDKFLEAQGKS